MNLIQVWRITDDKYSGSAFSGEGARLWGGRFNSPGIPAVYTSGSLSLALLETLVQTNSRSNLKKKVIIKASIPKALTYFPSQKDLPGRWNHIPVPNVSQQFGDNWIHKKETVSMRIPSVVVPVEYNYVINPHHPDIEEIQIGRPEPLPLDQRFFDN